MQARCPKCGALLHSDKARSSGQLPAKCWMCATAVTPNVAAVRPAAPTAVGQPAGPAQRWSATKSIRDSASETNSLKVPPGQAIKIRVVAGLSQGMEFELSRPLMTIGRLGGTTDIQIDDPEVSRLHCSVEVRGNAILLRDLGSTNGTFVDDSRVLAALLKRKSQFRIGSSNLQIDILSISNQQPKA
jgi:hypothetical protein